MRSSLFHTNRCLLSDEVNGCGSDRSVVAGMVDCSSMSQSMASFHNPMEPLLKISVLEEEMVALRRQIASLVLIQENQRKYSEYGLVFVANKYQ